MATDHFERIASGGQRAYAQFGSDPDTQRDALQNELAEMLLETYLRKNENGAGDERAD